MAWRIVRQPNGLLARFSDVVDNFTHLNMTHNQAVELCREYMGLSDALKKVDRGQADCELREPNTINDGLNRWRDSLGTIIFYHGEDVALEMVRIGALDHDCEREPGQ